MAKSQNVLEHGIHSTSSNLGGVHSHVPVVTVPQTYLTIVCPCGEDHKIDLSNLPQSTSRRMQVQEKCEYARHFVIHSGHAKYRKILIVSDFGEK